MKDRIRRIKELIRHKIAFWKVEKQTFKRRTWRAVTHDSDKLIMYFLPLTTRFVRKYHKNHAKHHNRVTVTDYYERLVDIECARYTKRNSTRTAREFLEEHFKYYNPTEYRILSELADKYNL